MRMQDAKKNPHALRTICFQKSALWKMVRDLHPNANGEYSEDRLEISVIGTSTTMNRGKQPLTALSWFLWFWFLMELLRSQIIIGILQRNASCAPPLPPHPRKKCKIKKIIFSDFFLVRVGCVGGGDKQQEARYALEIQNPHRSGFAIERFWRSGILNLFILL